MLENGVRIPSLDGKDIFISNNCVNQKFNENGKPIGFRLRNQAGVLNLGRFINTLDYSLDLIKMQEVFAQICPSEQFSFYQNKKDYTYRVINVTFKYSNKQYNKIQKGDKVFYILHKYTYDDLVFHDCVAFADGELAGVEIGCPVENVIPENVYSPAFQFDGKFYQANSNIQTINSVANIREELYKNGFYCDGIKYVRFKRSAGSSRVGKCLFIDERLYPKMHKWEMCGIKVKEGQDIDLAALEPYIALTLSSIVDTIQLRPENILVIDDYKSVFHDKAAATRIVDGRLATNVEDVEISNSIWDGQSLMDRSVFLKFKECQQRTMPEAREHGMLLLRSRFFKSCCFNSNIQEWFKDNNIIDVKQLNGRTRATRIEDIKLITTPSSIKYVKFGTLDEWLDILEPTFGVVKYEKPTHFFDGRMVQTHYQLLNTLQMTYEEVEALVQPSIDFARLIKNDPAALRFQISYAYRSPDQIHYTESMASKNDVIYTMLGITDKFTSTKMYVEFCNDLIKAFIKNLRCGHILIQGNYSTLCGNPIEMLKQAIGIFDGTSVIKKETVHSIRFNDGVELLGCRSPHVTMGNILLTKNVLHDEITHYMNPTNEIVYLNSIEENILERLSGADFDSDTMLLTDNQILIKAAKRNYANFPVPTKLVEGEAHKRKYTDAEKADLDIKTSVNKIGEIINLSQELNSILWDRLHNGASIESVMSLYCDIAQLDVMSNLEIDSAKRENPADNTFELQCLKKKYDVRDNKNRHVRPMFFKYIDGYKGYRDDYYIYCEKDDEFVKKCVVGTFKEVKAIKESDDGVCVERGRMSYVKYATSMDYLESCINKFKMPRKSKGEMSCVLVKESKVDGKYDKAQEKMIIDSARQLREDINGVWGDESYSNSEKRERTIDLRSKWIISIQQIEVSDKTIHHILAHLEDDYSDIRRHLFLLMMDGKNHRMKRSVYNVIQDSSTPIPLLSECKNGEIQIYDYTFRKELVPMPYDDQDDFRKYVKDFLDEYVLSVNWLSKHIGIEAVHISAFINGNRNFSKSRRMNLYRKIVEYIDRNEGF